MRLKLDESSKSTQSGPKNFKMRSYLNGDESDRQFRPMRLGTVMGTPGGNTDSDEEAAVTSPSVDHATRPLVLIVEDSRSDIFLIREALDLAEVDAEIRLLDNGESATKFVDTADSDPAVSIPKLVLLDLNLPKKRGDEVLRYLRNSVRCREVLVMVVSTSDSVRDRAAVEPLGISGYFKKPTDYLDFMQLGQLVKALLETRKVGDA
jgi:two-component system, chemotaxis family, response regulator Rcp1